MLSLTHSPDGAMTAYARYVDVTQFFVYICCSWRTKDFVVRLSKALAFASIHVDCLHVLLVHEDVWKR